MINIPLNSNGEMQFKEYRANVVKGLREVMGDSEKLNRMVKEIIPCIQRAGDYKEIDLSLDILLSDIEENLKHIELTD